MSDLISKSALMEDFRNTITENSDTFDWLNMISRQPNAYDVDKVIKLLKEKAEYTESKAAEYDENGNISMMDIWESEAKAYRDAIEIVKSGCVEMELN